MTTLYAVLEEDTDGCTYSCHILRGICASPEAAQRFIEAIVADRKREKYQLLALFPDNVGSFTIEEYELLD